MRGKARAQTNDRAVRLADVRSFGDLLGDISRKQARDAGQIGQIGGFKAGSQGVLPLELDAAAQAGGKAKLLGDVLGGLGSIGLSAGLSGQNIFGLGGAGANVATQGAGLSAARRAGNMIRLPG